MINTDATNAYNVELIVKISSTNYILGLIPLAASTGFASTIPSMAPLKSGYISGLAFDANGNPYLYLASGAVLGFISQSTVASGCALHIFGQGGDF